MTANGLVVPVDVVAYCVGSIDAHERTGTFAGATTSYAAQAGAGDAQAFLGMNVTLDPATYPPIWPLEEGVHLHWAAPDGLTHAPSSDTALKFPALPNRWLVTRLLVAAGSATSTSWIIESDTLSSTPPGGMNAPTLPVSDEQRFRYLGVWQVFDASWQEPTIPPHESITALFGSPLHAVASGDIAFAAFYPNARGVFGFHDAMADVKLTGSDPVNVTYVVTGWFADAAHDPLIAGSDPATLQKGFRWTYTPDGAAPGYSLYSGVVQDVHWNPGTRYVDDHSPPIEADVAIGNNPAEAIAAYVRGTKHPELPLFEQLFTAFEMGLLSTLQEPKPGQLAELTETVHERGFESVDAGTIYTIVSSAAVNAADDDPAPNLPLALADALNLLNTYQQRCDLAVVEVQQYGWQLFADWYRLMQVDPGSFDAASNALSDRLALQPVVQQVLADARAALTAQLAVIQPMLGSAWALKQVPAPRFWTPNEPVVLIASRDVLTTQRHGADGRYDKDGNLVCRLTSRLVTAARVAGSGTPVDIVASAFTAALPPAPNHLSHASDVAALVGEACVLNTAIAAARANTTDAALRDALSACLEAGSPPAGSPYQSLTGSPPSPVAMNWWGPSNPWLPLMMLWETAFAPLFPTAASGAARPYPQDVFEANFTLDPDDVGTIGYTPGKGAVDPQHIAFDFDSARAAGYFGVSALSTASVDNLEALLKQYLKGKSDATLDAILQELEQTNVALQPMSGLGSALLARAQRLQLDIGVGKGAHDRFRDPTDDVRDAIAELLKIPGIPPLAPLAPLLQGSFNPLRAGFAKVGLQLLDTFGAKRPVTIGNLYLARDLETTYNDALEPGIVYLQPRLSQAARILFRWLAADTYEYDEMNAHPATSPVCGWLVANHLEQGIFFYDQLGRPLGSLTVKEDESGIEWQAAPGDDATIDEGVGAVVRDVNTHLGELATMLAASSVAFFQAFYEAVDTAASSVSPPRLDSDAGTALLLGRPVAVVQASLLLQLQGVAALDETLNTFASEEPTYASTDGGLSHVSFPAVVGDIAQLDDGLVGYFKQAPGGAGYDLSTFFSAAANAQAKSGVVQPSATNLLLSPNAADEGGMSPITTAAQKLLILMDPRAGIHLSTGILPTQYIEIPPAHYADILSDLEATFLTAPVLRPAPGLALPVAHEAGFTWSWVEELIDGGGAHRWHAAPDIGPALAGAVWAYSPQQVTEGWLRLSPEVLAFTLQNASGDSSVRAGTANTLTLKIANRLRTEITFEPGQLVDEGSQTTGSVWYMHLGALVAQSQVASVSPSADGWTFAARQDDRYGAYWAATPAAGAPVTLAPGAVLSVTLANVVAAGSGSQAQVYFDYYGVRPIDDGVDVAVVAIDT